MKRSSNSKAKVKHKNTEVTQGGVETSKTERLIKAFNM